MQQFEIKYLSKKIMKHYLKTLVYGSFFYVCAFGNSEDYRLKGLNIIFIYISIIYLAVSLLFFIKDMILYADKTFIKIENNSIFYKSLKIEKFQILDARLFVKNENHSYGGPYMNYPLYEVDKNYTLILDLVNEKIIEIDLNNIFLEGNPVENYQKISHSICQD
jgi:hypothetical protein